MKRLFGIGDNDFSRDSAKSGFGNQAVHPHSGKNPLLLYCFYFVRYSQCLMATDFNLNPPRPAAEAFKEKIALKEISIDCAFTHGSLSLLGPHLKTLLDPSHVGDQIRGWDEPLAIC
jgi:hypothetical protein